MIRRALILLLGTVVAIPTALALSQAQLASYNAGLSDSRREVRISTLDQLFRTLNSDSDPAVLPLLDRALNDADPTVRDIAAGSLAFFATSTTPKLAPQPALAAMLVQDATLKLSLRRAFGYPEANIRRNALVAYQILYPVPPDVQDDLVDKYTKEKDGLCREMIVSALVADGNPSPKALNFLNDMIRSESQRPQVVRSIARAAIPPQALLPVLVDQLNSSGDPTEINDLVTAITKYGKSARGYTQNLTRARDRSPDTATKANINEALKQINSDNR